MLKKKKITVTIDIAANDISRNFPPNAYLAEHIHLLIHISIIYLAHIICQVVCLDNRKKTLYFVLQGCLSLTGLTEKSIITRPCAIRMILTGKNKYVFFL